MRLCARHRAVDRPARAPAQPPSRGVTNLPFCSASSSASVSTRPPRDTLMIMAVCFMSASLHQVGASMGVATRAWQRYIGTKIMMRCPRLGAEPKDVPTDRSALMMWKVDAISGQCRLTMSLCNAGAEGHACWRPMRQLPAQRLDDDGVSSCTAQPLPSTPPHQLPTSASSCSSGTYCTPCVLSSSLS